MQASDATTKMTAILNGFKLEAEDAARILDSLVTLDLDYATSTEEIATAVQYSANSARLAGVEYDKLAGIVTVVSSTTRQAAESIGNACKNYVTTLFFTSNVIRAIIA